MKTPTHLKVQPNDPEPVKLLLGEATRLREFGAKALRVNNIELAQQSAHLASAYLISACWLRSKLDGSIDRTHAPRTKAKK